MLNKKLLVVAVGGLLGLLISATALASPLLKQDPITDEVVVWELTKTTVVDPGQTVTVPGEGTFVTGYTIEAKAKAKNNNVVPEGQLRLTLNLFSPENDKPGQEAGHWYVEGAWIITKKDADPELVKVKHNPEVIRGKVKTNLAFNPIDSQQNWTAEARLPMSLAAGKWGRSKAGTLSLNAQMEGDLYLDIAYWPELKVK